MGRVLAFDYGTKRTGMAVTDEGKLIAFPLQTEATHKLMQFLDGYLKENSVDLFVVGEPRRMDAGPTHSTKYVEQFVQSLEKRYKQIPVVRVDERFTSGMAKVAIRESGVKKTERMNKELVDTTSAVIILQSWIEANDIKSKNT